MRVLLQRVRSASVTVENETIGQVESGLVAFVGIGHDDTIQIVERMADKTVQLRIFEDADGKMNRSILDVATDGNANSGVLVISQFTLLADTRKGRRPSFINAAAPDIASNLVERYADQVRGHGLPVATGRFGAHMLVSLVNDGPVTIWLDSGELAIT